MAKQISYLPGEERIAADSEEDWIERAAALHEEAERVAAEAKVEVERMILGEAEGSGAHR